MLFLLNIPGESNAPGSSHPSNRLGETLERLRVISGMTRMEWLDIVQLSWRDYSLVRLGAQDAPEPSLERIAAWFDCGPERIVRGDLDFQALQIRAEGASWMMPERYAVATYGRRRTTITTFEYLTARHGWRLRHDVLRQLDMSERVLTDAFAPVSMRFISDACAYLHHRHFKAQDFFAMGAHSFTGNARSLLALELSATSSVRAVLERMWGDCLPFFERNCRYRFLKLDSERATLEVTSIPDVAEEMGVRHLGNEHVCSLKAGMMATAPLYIGKPAIDVVETRCAHRGDPACVYEIDFTRTCRHQQAQAALRSFARRSSVAAM